MDIFTEAPNLMRRYREGRAFRNYVEDRMPLVLPALLVLLAFSLATTAGTIVYIGGTHAFLSLLAMIMSPFILIGSMSVLLFVFFSWLEMRAMARVSGRRAPVGGKLALSLPGVRSMIRSVPPVPWLFAALFVIAPFVFVALLSTKTGCVLFVAALLTPVLFSRFDR
jgi:hypothetical protein